MQFRPCIDIHNGKVKQIVGGSLSDEGDFAKENFVSERPSSYYAKLFRADGLTGGHVILLNGKNSPFYGETLKAAREALGAYPGGLMVGGGITAENAKEWLDAGASHVIVTSYVFRDGRIDMENLRSLVKSAGRRHVVLDLSCKKRDGQYYICTDRWQKFTDTALTGSLLSELASYSDEFLIHGIDVEGKGSGFDRELVSLLAEFAAENETPVTYAGGIRGMVSLRELRELGKNRIHATVGSALDIYGGTMSYAEAVRFCGGR
jgi:phosphoribosylformimino-5-aminoimidazole carboxamide ribotide isomerase